MIRDIGSLFLREFIKDPRAIGSVVPDSKLCVKALLKYVPFESARIILEFGSASGRVTRQIIEQKRVDSVLFCFEKNEYFFAELKKNIRGSNVLLYRENVLNAERVLREYGIARGTIDCIISTLPCSNLDYDLVLQQTVLPWLREGGLLVQYMHVLSYFKGSSVAKILRKYFDGINTQLVLPNIPPAVVYHCTRAATTEKRDGFT